ncbi:sugar ABC transporter substrate-binding protein [Alkalibacterium sp. 20]|uniref:sugar ABC transporter substrate-binding protein n=1 Tax=Alkalibacterium sp. 20 TaxID=1798803 RepID=UPI0008FFFF10|nr:substrate-binding domain-containing protein [Alkalibacterium sp. 20]OJF94191.1 ribose ABC transporter substrate-binding protein [Alkalibacterium sp. 20]
MNRHREGIVGLCIFIFTAILLVGCTNNSKEFSRDFDSADISSSAKEISSTNEADRKLKIGFSMDTLVEERWEKDKHMFRESIEALGAEVEIKAANGNDALQIAQAERMISQGIDLLVLVPHNAEAAASIVGKAQMADIPVISYDRLVMNANVDLYISFDNEKIGALQGHAITQLVPEGKYVYIAGAETDNNAHLMKKGVYEVLQPFIQDGKIEVVYDQWTDAWMPENAKANMKAALLANENQIDAVIAGNDATAGGVIEALEEQGLSGKIPVVGQDAELEGILRIVEGTQSMTVYKSIKSLTEQAAEIAVKMAGGEIISTVTTINNGKKDVPTILLTPVVVDQSNIMETVIDDGYHMKDDVYQND